MPTNRRERMIFAFLTVLVTVHAYVFYSLYVVNGQTLMAINGASGVLEAIRKQGGVYMFAHFVPIWAVVGSPMPWRPGDRKPGRSRHCGSSPEFCAIGKQGRRRFHRA